MAREIWHLLVYDRFSLAWWDGRGEPGAYQRCPDLRLVALSDTGELIVTVDAQNCVHALDGDFQPLWQQPWPEPIQAVAVAPLGQCLALADDKAVSVLSPRGERLWHCATPRALHHLAWVPETMELVGAADLGLICGLDRQGMLRWQEGLMSLLGSLAVRGDGQETLLACFSDGVRLRSRDRPGGAILPGSSPCRALAASYTAEVVVTLDLQAQRLERLERCTGSKQYLSCNAPITAFVTDAAGQAVVLTTKSGELSLWQAF
jgi:hypothetical protein